MSLKTLLKNKTFNEYVAAEHANMKACCEISALSYLTPCFKNFMSELAAVERKILEYIIMAHQNIETYMLVREISLGVQEPTNTVSVWCRELYSAGVLKRRKCKGKTGNIAYEYVVANRLLARWVIMKNTKVSTGIPELDQIFAGGLEPGTLVMLTSGTKPIESLVPGDTVLGSNGSCHAIK